MVTGSVTAKEKLNLVRTFDQMIVMALIMVLNKILPFGAIVIGIFLAIIGFGLPLTKYKGHWFQWSMSSRTCFLLLFASVVGLTIIVLQYVVWSSTGPDVF
ncbi:MAG: hypothetical protein JW779_09430 [Candidatus Thorarchaeota archaeon]|nr:hypothetical protein [Candidatus Thorarchaeota archaeon]